MKSWPIATMAFAPVRGVGVSAYTTLGLMRASSSHGIGFRMVL